MLWLLIVTTEKLFLTVIVAVLRLQEILIGKAKKTFPRCRESCGRMGREAGRWGSHQKHRELVRMVISIVNNKEGQQ